MKDDLLTSARSFVAIEERVGSCYPQPGMVRALCDRIEQLQKEKAIQAVADRLYLERLDAKSDEIEQLKTKIKQLITTSIGGVEDDEMDW